MKNISMLICCIASALLTNAQSPTFVWAKSMGGSGWEHIFSESITVDGSGNVYTTGNYDGIIDFDPGAGIFNLPLINYNGQSRSNGMFISKLDSSGNFIWAKSMVAAVGAEATAWSITSDASGNIYTTGNFGGTVDFDPNVGTFNLTSFGSDIFISKLDASGNFVWAKNMRGKNSAFGYSIAVDASGNVYITGEFNDTVDFDPNGGTFNLSSYYKAIFISKLDASGNFVWAKNMGGGYSATGNFIEVDASGNVYTTGKFQGKADFDPGVGTFYLSSAGNDDIFISKLNASGNFVWAKRMGGMEAEGISSIAIDTSGNVYTSGGFHDTIDFDPGAGTFNLSSAGNNDIFISKLDASGNFVWAKRMGGTEPESATSIAIDVLNNIYTTGSFKGIVDFDPGVATFNLRSTGNSDIFILKLNDSGNFVWAINMGDGVGGGSIVLDAPGNIYTTGNFTGTSDFDPGAGIFNLSSGGIIGMYVLKISPILSGPIETPGMYPNPCNGIFKIVVSWPTDNLNIEIYNILGSRIHRQTGTNGSITVDLTGQVNGLYFVKVMIGKEILPTQKLLKQ